MELTVYDPGTLVPIGLVEEITSLLWTRRYWAVGEFKLLLPFTDHHAKLIRPRRLIGKRGDNELAEIRYIYFRRNDYGMEEIEAQGGDGIPNRTVQARLSVNQGNFMGFARHGSLLSIGRIFFSLFRRFDAVRAGLQRGHHRPGYHQRQRGKGSPA